MPSVSWEKSTGDTDVFSDFPGPGILFWTSVV